jgi:choline kinase
MSDPKCAVILAAGNGDRLGSLISNKPKGFITLAGLPIIEQSNRNLMWAGIQEIILVAGNAWEYYAELAESYPNIRLIINEQYSNSESMYSLYCARDHIQSDLILVGHLSRELPFNKRRVN